MASSLVITIKSDDTQAVSQQYYQIETGRPKQEIKRLETLCKRIGSGMTRAVVDVQTSSAAPVAATGTITLVSAVATNSVTIGGVTFTFTSTPTLETDVEVDGVGDAADAAALAAAINAHSTIGRIITASSSLGVVTLTCNVKGEVGNFIALSKSGSPITVSGALLSGGTGGGTEAGVSYSFGI